MNNVVEKRIHLDSIIKALIWEQIPFEYDARELVIKLKGIDMTDVLLAIHDYNDEKITDLYHEVIEAKDIIKTMLIYQEGLSSMGELKQRAQQFLGGE